jgi:hypothetical protein
MGIQIKKGQFQEGVTTEENSLVANLNKKPEIRRRYVDLFPQYRTSWFLEKFGRYSPSSILKDNSVEWPKLGRVDKPIIANGDYKTHTVYTAPDLSTGETVATDDPSTVVRTGIDNMVALSIKHNPTLDLYGDFAHSTMMVRFQSGAIGIIAKKFSSGSKDANTQDLVVKVLHGSILESDVYSGQTIAALGMVYGEGSKGSYQNSSYEFIERNWTTTTRRNYQITRDAFTNVSWIEYNNQRLWYFEQEFRTENLFAREIEKMMRWGRRSMAVSSATDPQPGHPGQDNLWRGGGGAQDLTWGFF